MKKIISVFLLFISITSISIAQNNYQDVVYLKDGSIVRGVIIEQIPNQSLKLKTESGNVFVYKMNEIRKITKETERINNLSAKSGYQGTVDLGYAVGVGDFGTDRLRLHVINGYRVNPHFALGLGTGLHYYNDIEQALIPIFADFRSYFLVNEITPYVGIKIGYTLNASYDFQGTGFLFNPSVGSSFMISESSSLNVALGYELQKEDPLNFNAMTIDVGISF